MPLSELTEPSAVRKAIAEFDELGRDRFLLKHGFGPARGYLLVENGKKYDSKAIAGVAYGYQFPDIGPLTNRQFSGGVSQNGAATRLRELGFDILEL